MTWEETILYIRQLSDYHHVVREAYLGENLIENVERFRASEEFEETKILLKQYHSQAESLLDIGSGNGISAVAFALEGYKVTAVEPDTSETIGAKAITTVSSHFQQEVTVLESYAEDLPLEDESFDVVYARQAMHHAHNLKSFVGEAFRVLKKGGILVTVRDHVVNSATEKEIFLQNHPLQKFYGGENAFSLEEYKNAFTDNGFSIQQIFSHYQSVINYFPKTKKEIEEAPAKFEKDIKESLKRKIGFLSPLFLSLYKSQIISKYGDVHDESRMPGRLYSFVAKKY
jgi:ubiquinone/menaquinone biosynthesis C-methylase UbiE